MLKFKKNLMKILILILSLNAILVRSAPPQEQYRLRIIQVGGCERDEATELRAPSTPEEELHVKSAIDSIFADTHASRIVLYTAGKNGYMMEYINTHLPTFLPPRVLKACAG